MADLESRLRSVDSLEPPDLWPSIAERPPGEPPRDPVGRRVLISALALLVSAAAIGLATWAFRRTPVPVERPRANQCLERVEAIPHPPGPGIADGPDTIDGLSSVVAFGPDDAWAVGAADYVATLDHVPDTTILHWDGRTWSVQPSALVHTTVQRIGPPGTPTTRAVDGRIGVLASVAGSSPDDVWAVGGAGPQPLIEHWDGERWTRVAAASDADSPTFLDAVTVVSADDAWAVGEGKGELIEHWDGTSWHTVPTAVSGRLTSLSAAGPDDVWAVGNDPDQRRSIALHWDGRSWTSVPVPQLPGNGYQELTSVVARSASQAWAVGSGGPQGDSAVPTTALIERWDGTRWRMVRWKQPTPAVWLNSVAAPGAGEVWIGGSQLVLDPRHVEPTLFSLRGGSFRPVSGLTAGEVDALGPAGGGRLWILGRIFQNRGLAATSVIARRICRP